MATTRSDFLTSFRTISESLARARGGTLYVAGTSDRLSALAEAARQAGITVEAVDKRELRRLCPEAHDCALRMPQASSSHEARERSLKQIIAGIDGPNSLVLILDHVTDPQNYGALLRSADQFGVDAVVVPGRRAAPLSAITIQASAGTAHHATIVTVGNLAQAIETLKACEFWVYAAEMSGEAIHRARLAGRVAVILGSEGSGVSRLLLDRADASIRIPMRGHADSLNVSVACGIVLYEVRRQQGWFDYDS